MLQALEGIIVSTRVTGLEELKITESSFHRLGQPGGAGLRIPQIRRPDASRAGTSTCETISPIWPLVRIVGPTACAAATLV